MGFPALNPVAPNSNMVNQALEIIYEKTLPVLLVVMSPRVVAPALSVGFELAIRF